MRKCFSRAKVDDEEEDLVFSTTSVSVHCKFNELKLRL